jgi:phage/plasmid-associated DNA primase
MEDELHEHLEAVAKIFQIQDQKYKQELSEKQDLLTIKSKQNSDLQDENSRLLSIVQDLERKLLLSQSETKSLQSSFDSLSLRYQNVKKAASQLEAFRKVFLID